MKKIYLLVFFTALINFTSLGQERVSTIAKGAQKMHEMTSTYGGNGFKAFELDRTTDIYRLEIDGTLEKVGSLTFEKFFDIPGILYYNYYFNVVDGELTVYDFLQELEYSPSQSVCVSGNCEFELEFLSGELPVFTVFDKSTFENTSIVFNKEKKEFVRIDHEDFLIQGANDFLLLYTSQSIATKNFVLDFESGTTEEFIFDLDTRFAFWQKQIHFNKENQFYHYDFETDEVVKRPYLLPFVPEEVSSEDGMIISLDYKSRYLQVDVFNPELYQLEAKVSIENIAAYKRSTLTYLEEYILFHDGININIFDLNTSLRTAQFQGYKDFFYSSDNIFYMDDFGLYTYSLRAKESEIVQDFSGEEILGLSAMSIDVNRAILTVKGIENQTAYLIDVNDKEGNIIKYPEPKSQGIGPEVELIETSSGTLIYDGETFVNLREGTVVNRKPILNGFYTLSNDMDLYYLNKVGTQQQIILYKQGLTTVLSYVPQQLELTQFDVNDSHAYFVSRGSLWSLEFDTDEITYITEVVTSGMQPLSVTLFEDQVFVNNSDHLYKWRDGTLTRLSSVSDKSQLIEFKNELYLTSRELDRFSRQLAIFYTLVPRVRLGNEGEYVVKSRGDFLSFETVGEFDNKYVFYDGEDKTLDAEYPPEFEELVNSEDVILIGLDNEPKFMIDINAQNVIGIQDFKLEGNELVQALNFRDDLPYVTIVEEGSLSIYRYNSTFDEREKLTEVSNPLSFTRFNNLNSAGKLQYFFTKNQLNLLNSTNSVIGLSTLIDDNDYTAKMIDNYIYFIGHDAELGRQIYRYDIGSFTAVDKHQERDQFDVYPSVTQTYLNVDMPIGVSNNISYMIYNMQGSAVRKGHLSQGESIEIQGLESGMYIIRFEEDKQSRSCVFIRL